MEPATRRRCGSTRNTQSHDTRENTPMSYAGSMLTIRRTNTMVTIIKKSKYFGYNKEPMVIICNCGTTLELPEFTNTCPGCNLDYNSMGQMLAPRDQWGEETGESLSEILAIGHHEPEAETGQSLLEKTLPLKKETDAEEELFSHMPDPAIRGIDIIFNILGASTFLSIVTFSFVSEHIMPEYRPLWYHYIHKALDRINEINIKEEQEAAK